MAAQGAVQPGGSEDGHPLREGRQVLGDLKDEEEATGAGRVGGLCKDQRGEGNRSPAHALPKWEEFRSHTSTLSPLLPSPPPLLGQGHILNLTPLNTKDGWKGYSLLPGFGDHQILHHLPLQGQGLGEGEGIRPASLPHDTQPPWVPLTSDVFCRAWLGSRRAIRASYAAFSF